MSDQHDWQVQDGLEYLRFLMRIYLLEAYPFTQDIGRLGQHELWRQSSVIAPLCLGKWGFKLLGWGPSGI